MEIGIAHLAGAQHVCKPCFALTPAQREKLRRRVADAKANPDVGGWAGGDATEAVIVSLSIRLSKSIRGDEC